MRVSLENLKTLEKIGVQIPKYDVKKMQEITKKNPTWLHVGGGNIFRGFICALADDLLDEKLINKGIIAVETFDKEVIEKIYKPFDNLVMVVTLANKKEPKLRLVGSIADGLTANPDHLKDKKILKEYFRNPSLQLVSFTITEKGYKLHDLDGNLLENIKDDLEKGPETCRSAMAIITSMLYQRYLTNKLPLALVSMDNCSHNGTRLKKAILTIAKYWIEKGIMENDFISYLEDESKISFPWTMIDKITPRPANSVANLLRNKGIDNMQAVMTARHTFIAPYVNTEEASYLVIEDKFPNGRPPLEKAGVFMTDRETVNKVERMKVTACLNPLHTALAVLGCLLNKKTIANEMKDPLLVKVVKGIAKEGLQVVEDPKIISPKAFAKEVIYERLPNPAIPDTPQRIATDTSLKIPERYGQDLKAYLESPTLDLDALNYIPLAIASWFRYLLGVDDEGNKMECSPDPNLFDLQNKLKNIKLGDPASYNGELKEILSNHKIFVIDLSKTGLCNKIENYFIKMISHPHAVEELLAEIKQ